jgi:hypothetical protein
LQNKKDVPAELAALRQENARLKESSERAQNANGTYARIAYALARDYTDLFYVNMDTGGFVEYRSDDRYGVLVESRRASGFFESCAREAKLYVHPEDQDAFVRAMNREFLQGALDRNEEFRMDYRREMEGRSFYVRMRVSRMKDDDRYIVVAVSDIDELVMNRRAEERIKEERIVYARLHALTGNFIAVYVINPETNAYHEFSATKGYVESFAQAKEGTDFFRTVSEVSRTFNHPDDLERFQAAFTKENILAAIVVIILGILAGIGKNKNVRLLGFAVTAASMCFVYIIACPPDC